TISQLEDSAKAPCTSTTVGLAGGVAARGPGSAKKKIKGASTPPPPAMSAPPPAGAGLPWRGAGGGSGQPDLLRYFEPPFRVGALRFHSAPISAKRAQQRYWTMVSISTFV